MADDWHQLSFDAAMQFAREAIKGCILINGGAGAGLVAFTPAAKAAGFDLSAMGNAVMAFGTGALLAVIGFGLSYIAQVYISEVHPASEPQLKIFSAWRYAAVAAVVLSAVMFFIGLCVAVGSMPK